ncbi:MAG: deoxyguanosinetriphosphate triphosphohydrolase [Muribaculaceae bacterium]|nr:deoxyguanosinetriphosphate triphosphohydrolase [Alistipes senegalensis]MCM1474290.1 deoxyguanosinetriphosphate triphosphohydrolase [Muribaculaceae bacterium]
MREQYELSEKNFLCTAGTSSTDPEFIRRTAPEEKCSLRTEFQRDRDRILHSKAFRRLKHKTQVFLSPEGDHYRTRLTHTLEVSQIARTIARCMRLNEDLAEAVALGHDLGHSPFGHCGEAVLNEICPHGFKHYLHSVRTAEVIEGLNLTYAVRNGIECHTNRTADTPEGNIVRLADTIAYINHDIEDAVRAGLLNESDLPSECTDILGHSKSERITTLVRSVIENGYDVIDFQLEIRKAHDRLKDFMFEKVYLNSSAKHENKKAENLIKNLYLYFMENTDLLPIEYRCIMENSGADRAVCDYIAGMTDKYAASLYSEIFIPKSWK